MKIPFFQFAIGLIVAASAGAQSVEEYLLYAALPAATAAATEETVFRFNNPDDRGFNRVVQKITVPTLTVYRPANPAPNAPAMVVCPGGGYAYIAIDREGHALGRYFSARGMTVAVLKYRLPAAEAPAAGLPLPQQDALAAVAWLRGRAGEWGLNPRKIGILGASAGGHLAGSTASYGEAAAGTRPDFAALLYPVVLMDGSHAHAGSRQKLLGATPTPARLAEFSLERRARPGLPPHFLVHARDDKGVPPANSEALAEALRGAGVPAELLLVATGGHGFGLGRDAESGRWLAAFEAWLAQLR